MESIKEKEVAVLNTLIEYNNDRVEGYMKAAETTEDADLKSRFTRYSSQSQKFSSELSARVTQIGGEPATGTTNSGKLYRAWMDVKAALSGKDRKAILSACEYGEDVALKSYEEVLEGDEITAETRLMVAEHARQIRAAHDEVKSMRDMAKV
jgi:uncharacterized protein (TIGR02284 family)